MVEVPSQKNPTEQPPRSVVVPLDTADARPLSLGEVWSQLREQPLLRLWVLSSGAACLLVAFYLLQGGSELGAWMVLLAGTAGWLLRWSGAAYAVVFAFCWFNYFPQGWFWEMAYSFKGRVRLEMSGFEGVVAVLALAVYVQCHWRYVATVQTAAELPSFLHEGQTSWRQPATALLITEWWRILLLPVVALVLASVMWFLADTLIITAGADGPLQLHDGLQRPDEAMAPWLNRLMVVTAVMVAAVVLTKIGFGLQRWRSLPAEQAALWLQDQAWCELQREWRRVAEFGHWAARHRRSASRSAN